MFESTTYRTHYPEMLYPENEQLSFNLIPPRATKQTTTIESQSTRISWETRGAEKITSYTETIARGKLPKIAGDTLAKLITWNLKSAALQKECPGNKGAQFQVWGGATSYEWSLTPINGLLNE